MQKDLGLGDNLVNGTLSHPCHHALFGSRSVSSISSAVKERKNIFFWILVETIQQNLITSGIFQTSVNCLNRLTAPNLDLTRSQESYKSYSWRKNIFWSDRRDPISVSHKKKNTRNDGDSGWYYQRERQVKVSNGGDGKGLWKKSRHGRLQEDYGYL